MKNVLARISRPLGSREIQKTKVCTVLRDTLYFIFTEMEYCASAASMLAEEIWQIAEGFVEVPVNLLVQLKKCGKNIPND